MHYRNRWSQRVRKWRGETCIEYDLDRSRLILKRIEALGDKLAAESDGKLREIADSLRNDAQNRADLTELLVEVFALVREVAHRAVGMRPFAVQLLAGIALHQGKLVEMQTGEGKTLAAVLPACLNALTGQGVHILTFNDYLARRDAAWMGPIYQFLGLRVGVIQEGMSIAERRAAYRAEITYATAKEAGFDFLRMNLAREPDALVHRPFNYAIIDEADSILIDEARVPLIIAGNLPNSDTSPYQIAHVVSNLKENEDWETDENRRNVSLTDRGIDRVEAALKCGDLYQEQNYLLLTEVNRALHAQVLLRRDVDYIVREGRIELVDEFTGRVVLNRRWPDGLQAALEAKEGLAIQPGGRILGSITLQHFLRQYPKLSGMTATAQSATEEVNGFYGLSVVPIPPNRPCIREDLPDLVFTHREAKEKAIVDEIARVHRTGRPILVGTTSVEESELLADKLSRAGIECRVLNAKNDEAEAEIIAQAGAIEAVTISTNMAGRGTDIKLGGAREEARDRVVDRGGLYVIGTNKHETRRIDDQLRGRAGRQGDPGSSRFFVSLADNLPVRFGIDRLVPLTIRPARQAMPIDHPAIRRELERVQRIVEGQNYEIRKTLSQYSSIVEKHRRAMQEWRLAVLTGEATLEIWASRMPGQYADLRDRFGAEAMERAERAITLHFIDQCWAEHLAFIARLREEIHLVGLARLSPLYEFHKEVAQAFKKLEQEIEDRIGEAFETVEISETGIDLDKDWLRPPSSTWTYVINDQTMSEIQRLLYGFGNLAFAAGAVVTTWPLLIAWQCLRWFKKREK